MDAKLTALVVGIAILLSLFLGLFVDAVYQGPLYGNFCKPHNYPVRAVPTAQDQNCTYDYGVQYDACINDSGSPIIDYSNTSCGAYAGCDYCNKDYNAAQDVYSRNLFLIFMPLGLIIVIIGIYLVIDYIGAGLMFAGLITMFYATFRYFSSMSKILRALVVLIELLVIIWIGYKKIGEGREGKKGKDQANAKLGRLVRKK